MSVGPRVSFPYPTSSEFAARVALGAFLLLAGMAAAAVLVGSLLHPFWLALPACLALVAWLAIGPGMREELVVDGESKAVIRRVRTLGLPKDEVVWPRGEIRMVATAKVRLEAGGKGATYCLVVDRKGRWLVLSQRPTLEAARVDRNHVVGVLGVPGVEYCIPDDWAAAWGRVQPPAPVTKGASDPPPARSPEAQAGSA